MPSWSVDALSEHAGLYAWVGARLEEQAARPHPYDAIDGRTRAVPVPEALRQFRAGLPVEVPAWWLDGFGARAAGFVGVVPSDRQIRACSYVVGPDDSVTEGRGSVA
ncbi:hypothetical protein [Nocardia wallacei]|uniref:hypothetical protein n=1 Tax=Nocardia wallacei TaxID=480035 RepID=UPI002458561A|nr:hypothetical protein [Nocardia wallacei]